MEMFDRKNRQVDGRGVNRWKTNHSGQTEIPVRDIIELSGDIFNGLEESA